MLIIAMISASVLVAAQEVFSGVPTIVNGNTIQLSGKFYRLSGVDAPDLRQYCRNGIDKPYSCGRRAADFLIAVVGKDRVRCAARTSSSFAICRKNGTDLGAELLRSGNAVYDPTGLDENLRKTYRRLEREAKTKRIGIWAGTFVQPSEWRRAVKAQPMVVTSR